MNWHVAALYRFTPVNNVAGVRAHLKDFCKNNAIYGTLILADEGINGTVAATSRLALEALVDEIYKFLPRGNGSGNPSPDTGMAELELKYSLADKPPFMRLKVKHKPEIVTMRQPDANPAVRVGAYVEPQEWNDIISDPEMVVLDTRNDYEVELGKFEGAIDPKTVDFCEFAKFVDENLDPNIHKKVAMYCTGGIRCEKASSFMLSRGFEAVYHLKGGILKYLEAVAPEQSKWEGRCYVFDTRETLGHGLSLANEDEVVGETAEKSGL